MFETMPEPTSTKVKSGKYGPYNQTKREVTTRWVLNPEAEGVPKVVVDLFTSHRGETKRFYTTLTWATVEPAVEGSPFMVETWASDHRMLGVLSAPVARYSQKAMEAHHEVALAAVEANMGYYGAVFQQAAERNGLTEEVEA